MQVTVTRDTNGRILRNADLVDEAKRHFDYLFNRELYGGSPESVDFFLELLKYETVNTELIFSFIVQQLEFDHNRSQNADEELKIYRKPDKDYCGWENSINDLLNMYGVSKDPGMRGSLIYSLKFLADTYKREKKESELINFPVYMQDAVLPKIKSNSKAELENIISKIDNLLESLTAIKPFCAVVDFNYDKKPENERKGWRWGHWRIADRLFEFVKFTLTELKTWIEEVLNTTKSNSKGGPQNNNVRSLCVYLKGILKQHGIDDDKKLLEELLALIAGEEVKTLSSIVDWVYKN